MAKPNLYALFIGINNYANIRPLAGCEKDVDKMKDFLEKYVSKSMNFHPRVLKTTQATKFGIVKAFEEHLIRSGNQSDTQCLQEGDVVLFYFSGHGALEKAHQVFWRSEPNQYLETLACYDSDLDSGKNFLADKELRYLIHRAAKTEVEIVTIFDCCHSGDNTRAPIPPFAIERLAGVIDERDWKDFIFAKVGVTPEKIEHEGLEAVLPQGTHIQLAACNSHESAMEEKNIGGIFTSALLEALAKSQGDINYLELRCRIRNAVRREYSQTPQLYIHTAKFNKALGTDNEYKKLPFKVFLGAAINEKPIYSEVYYNRKTRNWELDKGAVYGLIENREGQPQEVVVSISPHETVLAKIKSVYPGFSEIEFEPYLVVLTTERYEAFAPSFMFKILEVWLDGEEKGVSQFHKFAPDPVLKTKGLKLLDSFDKQPEYCIKAIDGQYLITLPHSKYPLTDTVKGYSSSHVAELVTKLQAIRRWAFVKDLQNHSTLNQLRTKAISFELTWNDQPLKTNEEGHYFINFDNNLENNYSGDLKITIINEIKGTLHIGFIYLDANFGISTKEFWPGSYTVRPLDAGQSTFQVYDIKIEQFVIENKWPEELIYYKVIAAISEFDLDLMDQTSLDEPEIYRSKGIVKKHVEPNSQDWFTWLLPLHLINPNLLN